MRTIHHKDGNLNNNDLDNLEWIPPLTEEELKEHQGTMRADLLTRIENIKEIKRIDVEFGSVEYSADGYSISRKPTGEITITIKGIVK